MLVPQRYWSPHDDSLQVHALIVERGYSVRTAMRFFAGDRFGPFGTDHGQQHAVEFEANIMMHSASGVRLAHERVSRILRRLAPTGLGRLREVTNDWYFASSCVAPAGVVGVQGRLRARCGTFEEAIEVYRANHLSDAASTGLALAERIPFLPSCASSTRSSFW